MNGPRITAILLVTCAVTARAWAAPARLSQDQERVLASVRASALESTKKLPDFICTQITNRESIGHTFTNVYTNDVIEEQLTFANQEESYEVLLINGKKVSGVQHMDLPGAISAGEFGSRLHAIFDPQSRAAFRWDRMTRLRGRGTYVFTFQVPREAGIRMFHQESGRETLAAYGGLIFVDAGTKEVIRIATHVDLPPNFPIKGAEDVVDYRPVAIAGKDFTLPFHAEVHMRYDGHEFVNRIDYKAYHKFAANVTFHFDDAIVPPPEAVPANPAVGSAAGKDSSPAAPAAETPKFAAEPAVVGTAHIEPPLDTKIEAKIEPPPAAAIPSEMTSRDEELNLRGQEPIFRVQANLVMVPVVVRDAKGKAVGDLTQADFQLFDKGKRQQITKFTVQRLGGPAAETSNNAPGETPQKAADVAPTNFVAYLLDDVHLNFADLARVRDAAGRNLDTLQAGERAAIFTTSGQDALDFTGDRAQLHDALLKLRPHPRTQPEEQENRDSLLSLKETVRRLSVAPGKRSIILVSPGFSVESDLLFDEQDAMDRAIRANVVISALDARGLYTLNAAGDLEPRPASAQSVPLHSGPARAVSDVLAEMAAGTGGSFVHNTNDIDGGLRRLATPPDCTYLLGFTPEDLNKGGRFHPLQVKLTSRGKLSVQARLGYFAAAQPVSAVASTQENGDSAIYARDEIHDLPVELHTEVSQTGGKEARLEVRASIDLKGLDFRQEAGRNCNDLTVVSVVFDNNGKAIAGARRVVEMRLRDETVATLGQKPPMNVTSSFGLKPGKYLVRLVVRDSEGQQMTTENEAVEIP